MKLKLVPIGLFVFGPLLISESAASKPDKYVIPQGVETATLVTQEPYKKTSGKGRNKKKQRLFIRELRRECRTKALEIKHSEWVDQSIKLQANVELVIGQSKSSRKGKTISSCLAQLTVILQSNSIYELNFEGADGGCQFKVVNKTDPSEIFENLPSKEKTLLPKDAVIGLKIDRSPYCTSD